MINLPMAKGSLPDKISIAFNIEYTQPKTSFFKNLFNFTNKILEIDFDFSIIGIDKKQTMPNEKCFIFYNQTQSIGVRLETYHETRRHDFDEIISIDFNEIIQDVHCLKFILSNYNNEYFSNCKIQCIIYYKTILTVQNNVELYQFTINSNSKFKLMEQFEINILNPKDWHIILLENYHNYESKDALFLHLSNYT